MWDPWKPVPAPVRAVLERLVAEGHEAALVGGCVRGLVGQDGRGGGATAGLRDPGAGGIVDWDVASDAPPQRVLELFPRAVPIGLQHGTVMVPTPGGPVDVTHYRAESLEGDLARRDFTCNAMALPFSKEPAGEYRLLDPGEGRRDLLAGRLRAMGEPRDRLSEDPLRALRAARFRSCLGLVPDPPLVDAMASASLRGVAAERKRSELERLLLGPHVEAALALLQQTGLGAQIVPGVAPDAPAVVARTPARLPARLAAWLRGTPAQSTLARLRFPNAISQRVSALLALHPVDTTTAASGPSLRRVLRRVGEEGLRDLLALRQAECQAGSAGPEAARRLAALEAVRRELSHQGRAALVRADLAIQGADVMEALGCPPGPTVGRALAHLTECVLDDPSCNTRSGLLAQLERWSDPGPARGCG